VSVQLSTYLSNLVLNSPTVPVKLTWSSTRFFTWNSNIYCRSWQNWILSPQLFCVSLYPVQYAYKSKASSVRTNFMY